MSTQDHMRAGSRPERDMDPRLLFRNTMRITPGHADAFRRAIEDAVDFAEQHAPQTMVDVFIDDEHETATSFQIYPDSDAVLRHWELSDPYIAKVMEHCTIAKFEVFGSPSDEVRDGFARLEGVAVTMQRRVTGYLKSHRSDTQSGGSRS